MAKKELASIDNEEAFLDEYNSLNIWTGSGELTSRSKFEEGCGKSGGRSNRTFVPWMDKYHPGKKQEIDKLLEYNKEVNRMGGKIPKMEDVLNQQITTESLMAMYKQEINEQIKNRSADKVKALLDSMEADIVTTRGVLIQACMLAVTGYFASIQKRVQKGELIHTKEFKYAYEILKTELGEPVKIKETRTKNTQVQITIPLSKEDVTNILGNNIKQDLSIEVAEVYKDALEQKFNWDLPEVFKNNAKADAVWGPTEDDWADWPITEAEEIPSERPIQ